MALWQYNFFVLPKESLQYLSSSAQFENDNNNFDDSKFWRELQEHCDFFADIDKILPKTNSWNTDLLIYGKVESNCFEVLCKKNLVVSVSFRIDFTVNYEAILNELLEFFILNGLIVLDETLRVLPLNFEIIRTIIENSPQVEKYKKLSKQ